LLPDADFGAVAVGFDGGTRILRPFQVVDNDHGYFVAFAQVRLGSGADGLFTLIMWPGAGSWKAPTMECDRAAGPGHECETRTGAGGERFVVERGRWQDSDVTEFQVKVARPNGSLLVAKVNDEAGEGGPTPAPGATAGPGPTGPPMSTDQLIALLLTPGLDVPTSRTQPS
jgi:hypothetical protein